MSQFQKGRSVLALPLISQQVFLKYQIEGIKVLVFDTLKIFIQIPDLLSHQPTRIKSFKNSGTQDLTAMQIESGGRSSNGKCESATT